jgi:hypothetical protein
MIIGFFIGSSTKYLKVLNSGVTRKNDEKSLHDPKLSKSDAWHPPRVLIDFV